MVLLSWPGDLCCAAGMRVPAVTLVNLSPKWNPNLTPSAAALNTPDLRQRCKTDGSPVKAGSRGKHRRTEYRQIARAYCTDILGNNLESVNSGSQAFFLGLKIKRKQTFFSGWKLTWHIYILSWGDTGEAQRVGSCYFLYVSGHSVVSGWWKCWNGRYLWSVCR